MDVGERKEAADKQAEELRAQRDQAASIGARQWNALQESWNDHIQRIRAKVDERRAEHDRNKAEAERRMRRLTPRTRSSSPPLRSRRRSTPSSTPSSLGRRLRRCPSADSLGAGVLTRWSGRRRLRI